MHTFLLSNESSHPNATQPQTLHSHNSQPKIMCLIDIMNSLTEIGTCQSHKVLRRKFQVFIHIGNLIEEKTEDRN